MPESRPHWIAREKSRSAHRDVQNQMSKLKKIKQTNKKKREGRKDELLLWVFKWYTWGPHLHPRSSAPPHTPRQVLVSVCACPSSHRVPPCSLPTPSILLTAASSSFQEYAGVFPPQGLCTGGAFAHMPHGSLPHFCVVARMSPSPQGLSSPPHLCTLCLPFLI